MIATDPDTCYRAVKSRDRRFDGVFFTAVQSTGIYCRPSCPAITPRRRNVSFFATAAAAQQAGFRACKRCRPDATPGSPQWDVAADTAGRAMRLISDGLVEREGVPALAARLGYTPRHLSRLLSRELGAGPLALARAGRAQTARSLIESTAMPFADVAFASGFASVRQFNDTVRAVYACTPTELRARAAPRPAHGGQLTLRLAVRRPFAGAELLRFLEVRAVPGTETVTGTSYSRTLRLPRGHGWVSLALEDTGEGHVACALRLADLRDLPAAVERCRRLLDADCDPRAVDDELGRDPLLADAVRRRPGLRVPGHVDGAELAVRAVLGQQVSVGRARDLAAMLVARHGEPSSLGAGRVFPTPECLAELTEEELPMPRSRGRALVLLCAALAGGDLALDRSMPRTEVQRALTAIPGIGPWTAGYIAMRALGDPDVILPTDVGVRKGITALGGDPTRVEEAARAWQPWRSYAQMHLWRVAAGPGPEPKAAARGRERT